MSFRDTLRRFASKSIAYKGDIYQTMRELEETFAYDIGQRIVDLLGEGYFEVRRDNKGYIQIVYDNGLGNARWIVFKPHEGYYKVTIDGRYEREIFSAGSAAQYIVKAVKLLNR